MNSGCSTMLLAWVITHGISFLPAGSFAVSHTWYSCSCRGFAASKLYAPAFTASIASTTSARAPVGAVAGVEAHLFLGDALQALVDRLDVHPGAGAPLLLVVVRVGEDVG